MTRARSHQAGAGQVQTLVLEDWPPLVRYVDRDGKVKKRQSALVANGSRGSHRVANAIRQKAKLEIQWLCQQQGLQPMAGLVEIRPIFTTPTRYRLDPDNCYACLKAPLDALVLAKVLEDDDLEHVRLLPVERVVQRGVRRLVLELTESEAGPRSREEFLWDVMQMQRVEGCRCDYTSEACPLHGPEQALAAKGEGR